MDNFTLGWLPAVVPAGARRFHVDEPRLVAVLADAGAQVVDGDPDVELGRMAAKLAGAAPVAIVWLEPSVGAGRSRAARVAAKLAAALSVRPRARRERRRLRRLGYPHVSGLLWDVRQRAQLAGLPPVRRTLAERLPTGALIIGRRGTREPTTLEAALELAGRDAGLPLRPVWASIRPGPVLALTNAGVLRVAIGQGRVEIESQVSALAAIAQVDVPPLVADRLPRLLAHGRAGLATWSLERTLPGERPAPELTPGLVSDCVAFLVALHGAGGAQGASTFVDDADRVAAACGAEGAVRARALGERLERELADLPRGFGHGDFFPGNLLADGDRLTGVLDWDAAGPGRLPLVDLFHLELTRIPYGPDEAWGAAVLERLLPIARRGGSEPIRAYCRAANLHVDAGRLEALVLAYWLGYTAYQLRVHPDRHGQRSWIDGNLELVLRAAGPAVSASGRVSVRGAPTRGA